ncbi:MAG: RNA pyrophosphohydrolase [Immundisolibacteraceae bacterium]|nr:RNA pyrophosphohydrolase [Immundisolibacteraceae bacterium]
MIDADGFRPNVGIIVCSSEGELLWARRIGQTSWQFPQGGIKRDESPEQALYRELEEEVGLFADDVKILGRTQDWLRYQLPKRYTRRRRSACIGQKQIWFMLQLISDESKIRLDLAQVPEFDSWQWVDYETPVNDIVEFKKGVYGQALTELKGVWQRRFSASAIN